MTHLDQDMGGGEMLSKIFSLESKEQNLIWFIDLEPQKKTQSWKRLFC